MNHTDIFRVAILQKSAHGHNPGKNTESILHEMKFAIENNADILLLPECYITGYDLPIDNSQTIDDADEHLIKICETARNFKIGVVATALTKGKVRPQNSAFVIDKFGKILMKYSKVHTCDFADESCLESGETFEVCNFHGVKLGIMICYDREYPESARILMLKGAEIVLVPNDCESMTPRLNALSTRAYENMIGVAMANPPGKNKGNSCAYSPICWDKDGNCVDNEIILADSETSQLYFTDFNLRKIRDYRQREMMGNTFRKVKAYQELLSNEINPPFIREGQK